MKRKIVCKIHATLGIRMPTFVYLVIMVLAIFTFGCKPRVGELDGSVFIVTEERDNIKLGLVTIGLLDANTAKASLHSFQEQYKAQVSNIRSNAMPIAVSVQKLCADAKPISEEYDVRPTANLRAKLQTRIDEINELVGDFNSKIEPLNHLVKNYEHFSYEALGQPSITVKTDADGKFRMEMPRKGEFIITALASRAVGNTTEEYIWVVPISLEGKSHEQIFLSNDNMTSSDSPESVIPKPSLEPIEPLNEIPSPR